MELYLVIVAWKIESFFNNCFFIRIHVFVVNKIRTNSNFDCKNQTRMHGAATAADAAPRYNLH